MNYNVGATPQGVAAADLNGDGHPDVIVSTPGTIWVLMNNGDGTLAAPVPYAVAGLTSTAQILAIDLNGDGFPDLAVNGGVVAVLINAAMEPLMRRCSCRRSISPRAAD